MRLRHEFVEYVPEDLSEGVLYVSMPYATTVHKCACGCGEEVVAPLSPSDWSLTYNGEAVSLRPSIGNWNFACRSHYWITSGRVRWAESWSKAKIERGREADRIAKRQQYEPGDPPPAGEGVLRRLWRRLFS